VRKILSTTALSEYRSSNYHSKFTLRSLLGTLKGSQKRGARQKIIDFTKIQQLYSSVWIVAYMYAF